MSKLGNDLLCTYNCKVDTRGRLTIMPVVYNCREPRALGVPSGSNGSIPGEDLGRCHECFPDLNLSFKYDVKTDKPPVPVITCSTITCQGMTLCMAEEHGVSRSISIRNPKTI
jgi:hypothetical protein